MHISKIEECNNKKYNIYIDGEYAFALYRSEIRRFSLEENRELQQEQYNQIIDEVIYKRARERALYLIERRPYTTYKLRSKLREGKYPNEVIERVICFLEDYHYVDDYDYARMYIESYSNKKSQKAILYELQRRGIAKEITLSLFDDLEISDQDSICYLMDKYIAGKDLSDSKIRDKVIRHFMGKGFSYSQIHAYLSKKIDNLDKH